MSSAAQLPSAPGVYCILNVVTGRRGVGLSRNVLARVQEHQRSFRRGIVSSPSLRADLMAHGAESFVFLLLEHFDPDNPPGSLTLRRREGWWAQHLRCLSEPTGYNLEAGGVRSPASRFRDHERKLMGYRSPRYVLLPGVELQDAVDESLLETWFA